MKHILSLFITLFLLGCATSQVEAQSGKTKIQSKIASYEAEKTLDTIKRERKGKKFKMNKIDDRTFKEVEIE